MIKTCPICSNNFTAERVSKTYCSDRCRKQAFIERQENEEVPFSQQESIAGTEKENDAGTLIRNGNDKEYGTIPHKENWNRTPKVNAKNTVSLSDFDQLFAVIEHTIRITVKETLQAFSANNSIRKNGTTDENRTENENSSKNNTLLQQQENDGELLQRTSIVYETEIINENGNGTANESENGTGTTSANGTQDENTARNGTENENENGTATHEENKEKKYQIVRSPFLDEIAELVNGPGNYDQFHSPENYFSADKIQAVRDVSLFLRCLLESTLKLSRHRQIPTTELARLIRGYDYVLNSNAYKQVAGIFPASEVHDPLYKMICGVHHRHSDRKNMRFILKRQWKSEVIAMLYEIGNTVPLCKFSELFKEEILNKTIHL